MDARYDFRTAEPRLQERWDEQGTYRFDPARLVEPGRPYTIDTPPPTVSGQIHVGHLYSYTHADVAARYHRMKGESVFYPFGYDDNGLPTERFVEKRLGAAGARNGSRPRDDAPGAEGVASDAGRRAFAAACREIAAEVEAGYERLFRRLGLSADWRLRYRTIDDRSVRISQAAFLDLHEQGRVYRQAAPTLWCPECATALAQADVDDRPGMPATFATIPFLRNDGGELPIATTRPELLPACVTVFVHGDDPRYRDLVGRSVRTPLFDLEVPVLADPRADREKGTGAVMCCTFGDATDVAWWRAHGLPLRLVIGPDGRMNELAGPYAGLPVRRARAQILADLAAAGLVRAQQRVEHTVGVHERCGTPVEYLVAPQWFIRVLDRKERFLEAGRAIRWHPPHMRARYESWVEGLTWDWCVSRQRRFGVPFPLWHCRDCGEVVLAERDELPVDPREGPPRVGACRRCGGAALEGETDVMDTWATSSLTPRICATLVPGLAPSDFERRQVPMTLRPNAHDIIRTWDFYTIARSLYRNGEIPWTDVLISGHSLDPRGRKISKSKTEKAEDPAGLLERFSADAVRYWAASARTGADTVLSEEVLRNGGRLATKLWNAARLVQPHLEGVLPAALPAGATPSDRWLLARLAETIEPATAAMEGYELAAAKAEVERFFWADLCDNYLEMVKGRLYDPDAPGREAARYALYHALLSVLKMLAPVMPHVTEEIYLAGFAGGEGSPSIHVSGWPGALAAWHDPEALRVGAALVGVADAARRWKAERKLSVGAPLASLLVRCRPDLRAPLEAAESDLRSVTRAGRIEIRADPGATALEVAAA
ncbi:MAG TPA: valine--tRNA ligase [Chloroflexota bacterium]